MPSWVRGAAFRGVKLENEMATKQTVEISWSNMGGVMDSVRVTGTEDQLDSKVRIALIELIGNSIVSAGDTFEIREVQS